jgi:hypothetical protein
LYRPKPIRDLCASGFLGFGSFASPAQRAVN